MLWVEGNKGWARLAILTYLKETEGNKLRGFVDLLRCILCGIYCEWKISVKTLELDSVHSVENLRTKCWSSLHLILMVNFDTLLMTFRFYKWLLLVLQKSANYYMACTIIKHKIRKRHGISALKVQCEFSHWNPLLQNSLLKFSLVKINDSFKSFPIQKEGKERKNGWIFYRLITE
jgi:hypothetical protein